ncbi:hypothetical protein [Streptomyces niveus]|uniref:hypothetical protein n=1 Tax=Streptomyces niveus TaxID=193462 RepID=UPI003421E117
MPKYVASTTLSYLTWANSHVLGADDATRRPLTLVSTTTSTLGVSITTYRRSDGYVSCRVVSSRCP